MRISTNIEARNTKQIQNHKFKMNKLTNKYNILSLRAYLLSLRGTPLSFRGTKQSQIATFRFASLAMTTPCHSEPCEESPTNVGYLRQAEIASSCLLATTTQKNATTPALSLRAYLLSFRETPLSLRPFPLSLRGTKQSQIAAPLAPLDGSQRQQGEQ
jgi:hypothetical protein